MTADAAIGSALVELGFDGAVRSIRDLSGGCIHQVCRVELEDGRAVIGKVNAAEFIGVFEAERAGLERLHATHTVLTPEVLGVVRCGSLAVLVLEALTPATPDDEAWRTFGSELAALHGAPAGDSYGFDHDNHLGRTPQPNGPMDDWVEFNATHRLGRQLRLARDGRLLDQIEARAIERVIRSLDRFIPRTPEPALLHGDLWSGNALPARDADGGTRIAVIDPACSVGDGWADIAMMQLFGGFPPSCYEAYGAAVGDGENVESRIAVYQLYHVLNHVNMFGSAYVGQAMQLARGLGA